MITEIITILKQINWY